ncbi:hypothetical protein RZS08_37710, partial [Arthrospira platensis SPKY1]|nr:hypothetical protein [Arthrospira platensis SPKY1]
GSGAQRLLGHGRDITAHAGAHLDQAVMRRQWRCEQPGNTRFRVGQVAVVQAQHLHAHMLGDGDQMADLATPGAGFLGQGHFQQGERMRRSGFRKSRSCGS